MTDLLDEVCDQEFGHTDWEMSFDEEGNMTIKFFKQPREEYLNDQL